MSVETASPSERASWVKRGLMIDGNWVASDSGAEFAVADPGSEELIAQVADAGVEDARRAMDAAARRQPAWGTTAPRERAEILRRAFEAMVAREQELAELISLEMGKPLSESRAEVVYAAEFLRWFSEEAVRTRGSWLPAPEGHLRLLTMRQPVGICLLILPWNVPLAMGTRKIGPAIAAGCTMLVKPASQTPLSMNALAEILIEAGLPAGVLNVLPTTEPGPLVEEAMSDPRLRKLSFTGSTAVGRHLVERSAQGLLRVSMELGGNAPFVVFEDARIDHAAAEAVRAKLRNNAEACTAANRFYVHERVVDEFAAALQSQFEEIVVGPASDPQATLGPLIERRAVDKVDELVGSALAEGAREIWRGRVPDGAGFYCAPSILGDVPADARILGEEIFGPVAPIVSFSSEDELVEQVNATPYGLASYVFTQDLDRAMRVAERIEAGMVGLNKGVISNPAAPFGGIKASGFGREGGSEGIEEYLETKYVALEAPQPIKEKE